MTTRSYICKICEFLVPSAFDIPFCSFFFLLRYFTRYDASVAAYGDELVSVREKEINADTAGVLNAVG